MGRSWTERICGTAYKTKAVNSFADYFKIPSQLQIASCSTPCVPTCELFQGRRLAHSWFDCISVHDIMLDFIDTAEKRFKMADLSPIFQRDSFCPILALCARFQEGRSWDYFSYGLVQISGSIRTQFSYILFKRVNNSPMSQTTSSSACFVEHMRTLPRHPAHDVRTCDVSITEVDAIKSTLEILMEILVGESL